GRLRGIEVLDLRDGAIDLTVWRSDVLRTPDLARTLTILGDSGDTLILPEDGWQQVDTLEGGLRVITNEAATLLVAPGIVVEAAPTLVTGTLAVDEASPIGTPIATLLAVDVGGGEVSLTVASGRWFDFEPSTGLL